MMKTLLTTKYAYLFLLGVGLVLANKQSCHCVRNSSFYEEMHSSTLSILENEMDGVKTLYGFSTTAGRTVSYVNHMNSFREDVDSGKPKPRLDHVTLKRKKDEVIDGTILDEGLAVSPMIAIKCIQDLIRTSVFIQGVHDAIRGILMRFQRQKMTKKRVIILYVGTGPLAPLVLPLVTIFPPEELGLILLDVHAISIRSVKSIIKKLCVEDYIISIEVGDGLKYKIPSDLSVDIIVSEVMSSGLDEEPQVELSRRLIRQSPNSILIPESVRVDLISPSKRFMGTIFELNKTMIFSWEQLQENQENQENQILPCLYSFPGPKFPEKVKFGKRERWVLSTTVYVYKNTKRVLESGKTSLTHPVLLDSLSCRYQRTEKKVPRKGKVKGFEYVLGKDPGLRLLCF